MEGEAVAGPPAFGPRQVLAWSKMGAKIWDKISPDHNRSGYLRLET